MQAAEIAPTNGNGKITPPTAAGQWTIAQIIEVLSRPLPESMLEQRTQGGSTLTYIPWHTANKILDKYAIGWTWEIRSIQTTSDRLFLVGRLSIPTADGLIWREATGTEVLKEEKVIKVPNPQKPSEKIILRDEYDRPVTEMKELAYGDSSSNSEGMAFRRCAAKFGLGLSLYGKK
jgi:hypothetical protein